MAEKHGLQSLGAGSVYLTGNDAITDPLLSSFEVEETLPPRSAAVAKSLAGRGVGRVEVKKRGVATDPEKFRRERNMVRELIKQLGFLQLQQSVWAHPLPCLEQFKKIRDAYGIESHLLLLEAEHDEEFVELLKQFHLHHIEKD